MKKVFELMFAFVLCILVFAIPQVVEAGSFESTNVSYGQEDIVDVERVGESTEIYFPGDIVVVLEGYTGDIDSIEVKVELKEVQENPLLRSSTGYIYDFPGKIWASTSVVGTGTSSVYVERTQSKFHNFVRRTAHYRGDLPRTGRQFVGNKSYAVYTGYIKFWYAS
ncbi:hypothetical protein [Enterococcus sp. LJL90]